MVSVVFSGWTVAFREAVFPAVSVSSVWSSVTPVAGVTSRVSFDDTAHTSCPP